MAGFGDTIPQGPPDDEPCEPGGCGPIRALESRVGRLENSVRIVATGHTTLVQQITDQTLLIRQQDARIDEHGRRLGAIEVGIRDNTDMTRQIRDVVVTGRTMGRFARWLAPTLLAVGISVGVLKGWAADLLHAAGSIWHDTRPK